MSWSRGTDDRESALRQGAEGVGARRPMIGTRRVAWCARVPLLGGPRRPRVRRQRDLPQAIGALQRLGVDSPGADGSGVVVQRLDSGARDLDGR